MKTEILVLSRGALDAASAGLFKDTLRQGGVAVIPTETFYGLAGLVSSRKAVSRIYAVKGRDPAKPLSLLAANLEMVLSLTAAHRPAFFKLAEAFWPGPLTMVLAASKAVPPSVAGPGNTVAVRVPPLAWLCRLLEELGEPVTATSANLSGAKEISEPSEAVASFSGRVEIIIDGGPTPGGRPSTIIDLVPPEPVVLREGGIPRSAIADVLGIGL
jgi:L-threonylcarbamoyladenylate synthase